MPVFHIVNINYRLAAPVLISHLLCVCVERNHNGTRCRESTHSTRSRTRFRTWEGREAPTAQLSLRSPYQHQQQVALVGRGARTGARYSHRSWQGH